MNKKNSFIFGVLFFCFCLLTSVVIMQRQIMAAEEQAEPIELSQETEQLLVFYRDDCADCQAVFPTYYLRNMIENDTLFVNLNQPYNRKYISIYQLSSVPAFVKNKQRYEGTDKKEIQKIIQATP